MKASPFPQLTADEVEDATNRHWRIDGAVPLPIGDWLACPVCRSPVVTIRWFRWHQRPHSATVAYRCDVGMKCCECAAVWLHGVALTPDQWRQRPYPQSVRRTIPWRQVMKED